MTREEHYEKIKALASRNNRLLLKLPTGFGKSKIALDVIRLWGEQGTINPLQQGIRISLLIVVPKIVLMDNWREEISKWYPDWERWLSVYFVTYVSFSKEHFNNYDAIILDECHHFTERCQIAIDENPFQNRGIIAMSGTVPKEARERLYESFEGLWSYNVSAREAIEDEILPDPTVLLFPLVLNDTERKYIYVKNPKANKGVTINYSQRMCWMKKKDMKINIMCTEREYYSLLQQDVDFWDNFFKRTQQFWAKNNWLHKCGDRLKWLSSIKTPLVQTIQNALKDKRYITFCSSIEQAKQLGEFCIHSQDSDSYNYLNLFNEGKISNVTAVNVLNEGLNVTSCQVGLFAGINSSEIITKQRLGRILRHEHPIIILPYFVCTRDEEIVTKMMKDYNPELIHKVNTIKDLIEYLL